MPSQRQHQSLHRKHVAHHFLIEALVDTLLETIDEFIDLVQHREVLVDGDVHQRMRHTFHATFKLVGIRNHATIHGIDWYARAGMHSHQHILGQEEAEIVCLDVVRIIGCVAEAQAADNDEQ